jgi:hypothetical protein
MILSRETGAFVQQVAYAAAHPLALELCRSAPLGQLQSRVACTPDVQTITTRDITKASEDFLC